MPNIPSYRRRELPSTNIGAAPLPVSAANVAGGAIGQGLQDLGGVISNLGESLFKIKEADNKNKDLLAESRLSTAIKDEELTYKELTTKDGDVNNYEGYRKQSIDRINALKETLEWGNSNTKQRADLFASGWSSTFTRESEIGIISKRSEEAIKVTEQNLLLSLSSINTNPQQELINKRAEEAYREALSFKYGKELTDELVRSAKIKGEEEKLKNQVAVLKGSGQFDLAIDLVQKNTTIDQEKAQAMLANIESYRLTLQRRAEADKYNYEVKTTEEFINKITLDPSSPERLNMDDIQEKYPSTSEFDKKKQRDWKAIVDGSLEDAPEESSGSGYAVVIDNLSKLNKGTIKTQEAYENILKERYVKKNINGQTFQWAIKRINSPYPEYLSTMIENEMTQRAASIKKAEDSAFYMPYEKKAVGEKVEKVQMELFKWVDEELAKNPNKIFTPLEIHKMRAQIGATVYQSQVDFNSEPQTKQEFLRNVADLKTLDIKRAKEYYDKWSKQWQ